MNILLTGSHGYIGSGIIRHLGELYNIVTINRQIFDLRDTYATKQWFAALDDNTYFDIVIHTAIKGGNRLQKDTSNILDDNLIMYLNLLNHKERYKKFINIGSGAEKYYPDSFYGLSKKTIATSILDKEDFYNLRIYGIFDEYELDRRLIKSSIYKYLNNQNIIIYQNKYMDFIYFNDFISILKQYINLNNTPMPKNIDCVYKDKYMLTDIANIINRLDTSKVKIMIQNETNDKDYIGEYYNLNTDHIGLIQGIQRTYRKLKDEKNLVRT